MLNRRLVLSFDRSIDRSVQSRDYRFFLFSYSFFFFLFFFQKATWRTALVNVLATYETSSQRREITNCLWSFEARAPPPHEGSSTSVNVRRHRIFLLYTCTLLLLLFNYSFCFFFFFFFLIFFFFYYFFFISNLLNLSPTIVKYYRTR